MQHPEAKDFGIVEDDVIWAKAVEDRIPIAMAIISTLGWIAYAIVEVKSIDFGLVILGIFTFVPVIIFFTTMALTLPVWGLVWVISRRYRQTQRYQRALDQFRDWWRRTQTDFWRSLSGRQFEAELASIYRRAGYRADLTRTSGDEGVDIWLHTDNGLLIVQCKAHKTPVGPAVVRELYGTLQHFQAAGAILASTSGFTPGVIDYARGKPIELLGLREIIALQEKHGL